MRVVTINNRRFLIQSVLKLSKTVNVLGFWEEGAGWSKHVHTVTLSHAEYEALDN